MKCRKIVDVGNKRTIVWFGSIGAEYLTLPTLKRNKKVGEIVVSDTYTLYKEVEVNDINYYVWEMVYYPPFKPTYVVTTSELPKVGDKLYHFDIVTNVVSSSFYTVKSVTPGVKTGVFVEDKKSYSTNREAVVDSLTQKLSVIKNELWFSVNFGLPLFNKYRSKGIMDSEVISLISTHPDVISITEFFSKLIGHDYSCEMKVNTKYGAVELRL